MAACIKGNAAPRVIRDRGVGKQSLAACETQFTANVIDFQSRQSVAEYRGRWLKRRIPVGPELAAFLAEIALGEGRQ